MKPARVLCCAGFSTRPSPAPIRSSCCLRICRRGPTGRCIVVGAGKSAAKMAAALEDAWPDVELSGLVVTRYGHAVPTRHIDVMEAAHPVPDDNSMQAARRMLTLVAGLSRDDLVLALISGGGSALLALPLPGLKLADKQAVNRALLASGATIAEMNAVRRRLSAIKGGRLAAAAAPAKLVTLAISDVPGDDPRVIASGPTVPGDMGVDISALLGRSGLTFPPAVMAALAVPASVPPAASLDYRLIATPAMALRSAASAAQAAGVTPLILGDALEGESRELGTVMAGIARSARHHGQPVSAPCVLLSGGETTVTIGPGTAGRGGRNTEFLLGPRHRAGRRARHLGACRRYRRNRWDGGCSGRASRARNAGARACCGPGPARHARRSRQLHAIRRCG